MKFTVYADEFKRAMEKVYKVTGNKTIPVLENIRLSTRGGDCHLMASNLEQYVDMTIDTDSTDDVDIIFSETKELLKAMKFFTGSSIEIEYIKEKNLVTISCGGKKAKQITLDIETFPEFPVLGEKIHNSFEYNNKKLQERYKAVNYAVSTEEHKKLLQGICFRNSDMVALDGFRLALNKDDNLTVDTEFVVPSNAIKMINEIMNDDITVETDGRLIKVKDSNTTFISRLIEGDFFKYSDTINQKGEKAIMVDIKDFSDGLKYLKTFIDSKTPVAWLGNKIATENFKGYFESEVKVSEMAETEIAFNPTYMLDGLSQFKKKATIRIGTSISPMLITSEEDSNNIALVLPVRPRDGSVFNKNKENVA